MPDNDEHDPLESWLNQQVRPLPPPQGTFELITRRARRRKLRRAAITAVSGTVVAAGVVIAATNPMLLHLMPPSESGQVAAGTRPSGTASDKAGTQEPNGTGSPAPSAPTPASSAGAGEAHSGPVPPNFAPSSVTFVSATRAWVIGQAGTPGSCYNGNICTSVAWTSDDGTTWHGEHAPVAGAPSGPAGVSGIRFLEGVNGWAFGPELWATHDGGNTWKAIGTSGRRVTDLETAGDRAYALFATCSGTSSAGFAADCTSYTLMTTTATSDNWTPVGAATTGLTAGSSGTSGTSGSAMLVLTGTEGYLVAPDGSLYSGPLGGTWSKTGGTLSCPPGDQPQSNGLPNGTLLSAVTASDLRLACASGPSAASPPVFLESSNAGATWSQQQAGDWSRVANRGVMTSFTATSSGKLLLATTTGIYVLPAGSSQWQSASVENLGHLSGGFSYIGMTTPEHGVALPADSSAHEIYVTSDGGLSWNPSPIG
jgi:hypothetical protein